MNPFLFAWRNLWREWRAGELRVLALALVVAVGAVSAVGFFTDRVRGAMDRQSGELLAADRVVERNRPIEPGWAQQAEALGIATAPVVSFRTVVVAGGEMQLTEAKAVGAGYPLRGHLEVAESRFAAPRTVDAGPAAGRVWVDGRLADQLGLTVGDTLQLGSAGFMVDAVLIYEPDRGGDLFSIAPRLMMNLADLESTGLLGTGALAEYRLLLAGPPAALEMYRRWIVPRLDPGARLVGRESRPQLNSALERGERFLGLAALVSVLLAGVAAAVAAHRHAARHFDAVAVMRCIGARQRTLTAGYLLQLLYLGLIAALVGSAVGFAAQGVLAGIVGELYALELPAPTPAPLLHAALVGLVALGGFAMPPLLALAGVPPLRVLRREIGGGGAGAVAVYGSAGFALLLLMAWEARDAALTAWVFAGTLATLAVLWLAAAALVGVLGALRRGTGVSWRYGLLNIPRRAAASRVQVVAFGLGIMILLLLSLVRLDLLEAWRTGLPEDAPNQFLINVQPDQVEPLRRFFAGRGGVTPTFHPMVRGRLTAINGEPVSADDYEEPRAKRLVRREFNLSWAERPAPDNRIVAGQWWGRDTGTEAWSVEQGLAETLGIALGDRLTFGVAEQAVEGEVTSLRAVEWDSFHVNFFVVAPPGMLEGKPASYITSFYLPPERRPVMAEMLHRFPNVTVIDVDALMERVRTIMDRVTLAVEFVFGFTLLAGVVVLVAAAQATQDERRREAALLRTLGAGRRQVRRALTAEFVALGLLAGVLAALSATTLGYLLAERFFGLDYAANPWVFAAGLAAGGVGVGLVGLWGSRSVLSVPPLKTLREA